MVTSYLLRNQVSTELVNILNALNPKHRLTTYTLWSIKQSSGHLHEVKSQSLSLRPDLI
jgi:hypothetical protein